MGPASDNHDCARQAPKYAGVYLARVPAYAVSAGMPDCLGRARVGEREATQLENCIALCASASAMSQTESPRIARGQGIAQEFPGGHIISASATISTPIRACDIEGARIGAREDFVSAALSISRLRRPSKGAGAAGPR